MSLFTNNNINDINLDEITPEFIESLGYRDISDRHKVSYELKVRDPKFDIDYDGIYNLLKYNNLATNPIEPITHRFLGIYVIYNPQSEKKLNDLNNIFDDVMGFDFNDYNKFNGTLRSQYTPSIYIISPIPKNTTEFVKYTEQIVSMFPAAEICELYGLPVLSPDKKELSKWVYTLSSYIKFRL